MKNTPHSAQIPLPHHRKRAPGGVLGRWLCVREHTTQTLPKPVLSYLSCRNKKGRPAAATTTFIFTKNSCPNPNSAVLPPPVTPINSLFSEIPIGIKDRFLLLLTFAYAIITLRHNFIIQHFGISVRFFFWKKCMLSFAYLCKV